MSRKKRLIVILLALIVALFLLATWYQYTYSMDETAGFEIHSVEHNKKLLIATQGSEFKDSLTRNVINHFKNDSLYIKVIDVSSLNEIAPEDYKAILLIHTWENWKPPIAVKKFIDNAENFRSRIVVITTSGEGSYKMEGLDAITGESKPENITPFSNKAIEKLAQLLN
jgi:hypothetical protein